MSSAPNDCRRGEEKQKHEAHGAQIAKETLGFLCKATTPAEVVGLILAAIFVFVFVV